MKRQVWCIDRGIRATDMRILFDGLIYSCQHAGGIGRYFANIVGRLPTSCTPIFLAEQDKPIHFPQHPNLELYVRTCRHWPRPFRRLSRLAQRRYFRHCEGSLAADLLHPTYYSLLSRRSFGSVRMPVVLTVHDFIHERFANELDPQGKEAEMKRLAIGRAQAIICVSEHTKRDLVEFHSVPESRIAVIHHATDLGSIPPASHRWEIPQPYFLFVGRRAHYKNFDRLLIAIRNVAVQNSAASLCVVGAPFTVQERATIDALGLAGCVVNVGYATDAELSQLYRGSIAFVYPSLYEGFGLPLLEAMACGTLVIASNVSSIPEVVGDAGILFDPYSVEDLTEILRSVLARSGLREPLIAKGHCRAKRFSWDRSASEHVQVYRSVSDHRLQSAE